tara:strand:- start:43 stop:270 length:228 start_codon:yes stop_codon:yes gene_type:complete
MNMIVSNPINTIDENTNPLASLVNFERTIEKIDVEQPIKVHLIDDNKIIRLEYKGDQIFGKLGRSHNSTSSSRDI